MLFYVQEELDFHETREVKTWYSIGQALNVDGRVLDGIETSYRSQQSPMRKLIQYLKTKGEEEPSMRDFVNALLQCKRYDVAENICNCPWPLTEAELERQSPEKYNMFLRDKETKKRNGETTVGTGVGGEGRVFRRLRWRCILAACMQRPPCLVPRPHYSAQPFLVTWSKRKWKMWGFSRPFGYVTEVNWPVLGLGKRPLIC